MMLPDALLHAAVGGVATALPLSASAHRALLRLWLAPEPPAAILSAAVSAGCAVALAVVMRQRLGKAALALVRQAKQPRRMLKSDAGRDAIAVLFGGGVSVGVEWLIEGPVIRAAHAPTAVGLGLMLTALALASTLMAPSPRTLRPGVWGSGLVGLAHGLGLAPGASQVAAAFVVASWLGIRRWRAVEVAFLIAAPTLLVRALRAGWSASADRASLTIVVLLAATVAAVAAGVAAVSWRWLCHRHATLWLLIWIVPLSLASLAYGRAIAQIPQRGHSAAQQRSHVTCSVRSAPWRNPRPML